MISVAVCDDDPKLLQWMEEELRLFSKHRSIDLKTNCYSSAEALLGCGHLFDLIFLDIRLKYQDGMKAAKELRRKEEDCEIIFITVLKELVFEAFEVRAADFLVKPIQREKLWAVLERECSKLPKTQEDFFLIKQGWEYQRIRKMEVYYCEVIKRKLYFHLKDKMIEFYGTLEELEKAAGTRFFRCHRSYLVNLEHIIGMERDCICLEDGSRIPLSKHKKTMLLDAVRHYQQK